MNDKSGFQNLVEAEDLDELRRIKEDAVPVQNSNPEGGE